MPSGSKYDLTAKQRRFCEEYVKCYNTQMAYHIAYPTASQKTIAKSSYNMLKNPKVLEYVRELQEEAVKQAAITPAKLLMALNEILDSTEASNAEKMKAIELLQKQMGLLTQKIEAEVKTTVIEVNIEEE